MLAEHKALPSQPTDERTIAAEVLDACEHGEADDWVFWVYVCDQEPALADSCARAVYWRRHEIGLAWSPAGPQDLLRLPATTAGVFGEDCVFHWVELLYDGAVIDRQLAAWLEDTRVSLPVPVMTDGGGSRPPWVSRPAWRLLRLANLVDPDCGDFEAGFLASGLQVR